MSASNTMTYSGYHARVEFDADDNLFAGCLAGINDVIGFHADTVAGLVEAFREAVDDYVAICTHEFFLRRCLAKLSARAWPSRASST